jgi:tRNA nucleotidyltransferase/poly(A) polymerase
MLVNPLLPHFRLTARELARQILSLPEPPSPEEASILLEALRQQTGGFQDACQEDHQAAAQCIGWGAELRQITAGELALSPLHAVEESCTIAQAAKQLEFIRGDHLLLAGEAGWTGLVGSQELHEALRHGLHDSCVQLISRGAPPIVPEESSLGQICRKLSGTSSHLLVRYKDGRTGYIDRRTALGALRKHPLPEGWEAGLGPLRRWMEAVATAAKEVDAEAFLVGGCVRDLLLGLPIRDMDFILLGDTQAAAKKLQENEGGSLALDPMFGAAHWTAPDGTCIDITRARTEVYTHPGALPAISTSNLLADLNRRDFTINMMAVSLHPERRGMLLDPNGGRKALHERVLEVVHGLSFLDDPTRILRASRYCSRLGLQIAPGTLELLRRALEAGAGRELSPERLGNELERLFGESSFPAGWRLLRTWGALEAWFPETVGHELDQRMERVCSSWAGLRSRNATLPQRSLSLWVVLSASFPETSRREGQRLAAGVSGRQKLWLHGPRQLKETIEALGESDRRGSWGKALQSCPHELLACIAAEGHEEAVVWWLGEGMEMVPAFGGGRLIEAGCPRGPMVGEALGVARRTAWEGGSGAEQLAAAMEVWTDQGEQP